MQKKRYHIVRTIQNQISKSSTEAKSIPLTHKCMIAHFPGLVQAFQCGVKLILWAQSSSRNEMMRTCKGFPQCQPSNNFVIKNAIILNIISS